MTRIAIVGGGISGLAAAFSLEEQRRSGAQVEYTLYEASSRLGGVLQFVKRRDVVLGAGSAPLATTPS